MIEMFLHNFKYTFKTLFKNKSLIFWTFAFPIILGTLFHMAFSDIESSEKLHTIKIAIIGDSITEEKKHYDTFLSSITIIEEEKLFEINYTDEKAAKKLLDDGDIKAIVDLSDKTKITVKNSGIEETIISQILNDFQKKEFMITTLLENKVKDENFDYANIDSIYQQLALEVSNSNYLNIEDTSQKSMSYTVIEFYTLIAMACLYGGTLGLTAINKGLANMSSLGKRTSVSPTRKIKIVISSALASFIISLIGLALLFLYTIFVLKVDYGTDITSVIILACIGSFAGLTFGIAIASVLKTSEITKTGIMISVTMLGCFLSGMMGITMKYIVDKNIPILNMINPANMITDGFYSLYYYETRERFYYNIISLLIFSLIMILLSVNSLRRQRYDSI